MDCVRRNAVGGLRDERSRDLGGVSFFAEKIRGESRRALLHHQLVDLHWNRGRTVQRVYFRSDLDAVWPPQTFPHRLVEWVFACADGDALHAESSHATDRLFLLSFFSVAQYSDGAAETGNHSA